MWILIISTKIHPRSDRPKLTLGYTEILGAVVILAATDSSVRVYGASIVISYHYSGFGRWMRPVLGILILWAQR